MSRRVVITGMGVVSCLGNDTETLWKNIRAGKSGIDALSGDEFAGLDTRIAGQIAPLDQEAYLSPKEIKRYDPMLKYAYIAARQALDQAAIEGQIDSHRVGIYIGSGAGGLHTLVDGSKALWEKGPRKVSPFLIPLSINNMAAGLTAIKTGFTGPSFATASACATSNHAIGEAYVNIAHGYTDAMLAGGSDATIMPLYFAGFNKMQALSTRNNAPQQASRPFDRDRDGFVMAEGAGVLFLEALPHAKARGATILGEIIGYAASTDAHHMTSPYPEGAAQAMRLAIERAGLAPADIDYINAHGTSTPQGDASEAAAIHSVFTGNAANVRVSSTKSMTGHMFGAAGGIESMITLMAMREGFLPATLNLEHVDPECDLDHVTHTGERYAVEHALSNGFGFGGHNAVLAFKTYNQGASTRA